ncbi:MAG: 2OG-Fe(II) oxygenase [Casimicrobiaceae bacterium]
MRAFIAMHRRHAASTPQLRALVGALNACIPTSLCEKMRREGLFNAYSWCTGRKKLMIAPSVIGSATQIRDRYQAASPFKHVVVDGFLDVDQCEALLRDFPPFNPKYATDEQGRTGRKAVVERVSGISSSYRDFYRYINSAPFLAAISELTGIPDLIADDTLFGGGTHDNQDGQGLDNHVDFNFDERRMLHRRLNLLIYLNKEWKEEWGGAIELHSNPRDAAVDEVKSFLPLFNRALIFETNEYSWHGFKRIALPPECRQLSRKSFSIYLYTKERPVAEVVAPHTTFYVPQPLPERFRAGHSLTEKDALDLHILMASRDGLLEMYQRLLIEKEERLHSFMRLHQEGQIDFHAMVGSRSWRLLMALQRMRYRMRKLLHS